MNCHECEYYQTEECISCIHPIVENRVINYTCPICGSNLEGDGYTSPVCCENVECPEGAEPDSGPYYCSNWDEIPF